MLATAQVPLRASTRASQHPHTITDLARECDICACAMPLYEDLDLLPQQRVGRNRIDTQRNRTRLKLTLQGKRPGLRLLEVKQLVDMFGIPSDTAQRLTAFMGVPGAHRPLLAHQREDIEITLTDIAQHEERCCGLLLWCCTLCGT